VARVQGSACVQGELEPWLWRRRRRRRCFWALLAPLKVISLSKPLLKALAPRTSALRLHWRPRPRPLSGGGPWTTHVSRVIHIDLPLAFGLCFVFPQELETVCRIQTRNGLEVWSLS